MGLPEQLQEQGWHLLPAGIERLLEGTTGTTIEVKQAIKLALDIDLREIGGGALSSISSRGSKADTIDGNIVVQILKIRNISAPKANEESKVAPRLLKLTLTDGQTQYSALEGDHISALSLDTPPGTKLYLKNGPIKISQGLLILHASNVSVLGGKVPALVEKWELGRAMAKYAKGGRVGLSASGPPPWIAFGQKIQQNLPTAAVDKNFKSLQTKEKDESKENAEFNALRNDAIAEANKLGTKKTFGGGAKQMVDANVQKIMDKGFTEDQANHALKLTRNNVHRALSNLQRIEDRKQNQAEYKTGGREELPPKLGKQGPRGKRDSESESSSKPSAKVSLFDFLEDILPETDSANKKSSSKESTPFSGKNGKPGGEGYSGKPAYGSSYPNASSNSRSASSAVSSSGQYQNSSSSHYSKDYSNNPGGSKSYNQQRFENNISSSFANRNSHTGSNPRGGYNQQPPTNASSGYKQSSDYNSGSSSRYRGPPGSAAGGGSEMHPPRGPRPDSKYNQSHSSYNSNNNPHHQQNSQYQRNDGYNNNSNASSGAPGGGKYAPNTSGGSGKSQPPSASYGGYGGHGDSRNSQNYNGQADGSRKQGHYQQQQQQHQGQSSYHSAPPPTAPGNKPIQGYNAPGSAGNQSTGLNQGNATNHYGQQNAGGNNSYNSSKPKVSRYGKEEFSGPPKEKFSGPPPMSTGPPQQGRKPPPPKIHQNPTPPAQANPIAPGGGQPPYNRQPSGGAPPTGPSNNNNVAQLTEATANMQLNSKPFNSSNNSNNNNSSPPQVMAAPKPLQGPTTAAAVVPKNFIQLPNGFNYNPYQIMGFQNKQTNEFALNVLKSQQFDALQTAHMAPPGGPPVQAIQGVAMQAPPTAVVSSVLAPAGGVLPNWKVGDRCLAKYWEDGGFYNAEITGISENTFVVCFLEYGNYEEVLKTDCIPLSQPTAGPPHAPPPAATMGFHPAAATHLMMPAGAAYPGGPADSQPGQHFTLGGYKPPPPQPSQYSHHHAPPPPHHHQHQQQQRPSKFREQRPMYVPPAQRK